MVYTGPWCAGIYYPPGSLKARLCVDGKRRMYEYCESHGVPYNHIGKILVASEEYQLEKLRGYSETARKNGVRPVSAPGKGQ